MGFKGYEAGCAVCGEASCQEHFCGEHSVFEPGEADAASLFTDIEEVLGDYEAELSETITDLHSEEERQSFEQRLFRVWHLRRRLRLWIEGDK